MLTKVSTKKVSSKKVSSKSSSVDHSFPIGKNLVIIKDGPDMFEYNLITEEITPISKSYYEYKKFMASHSTIKPSHLASVALALASIGAGALLYSRNPDARKKILGAFKKTETKNEHLTNKIEVSSGYSSF